MIMDIVRRPTSLSLSANIMALVCSAALPTIGKMITLMNAMGTFHAVEAPCVPDNEYKIRKRLTVFKCLVYT